MTKSEDTIKMLQEAKQKFEALSQEEQEQELNSEELDLETFYNRSKDTEEEPSSEQE